MYEICGLTLVMMYSFVGGFMLGMLLALISFTAKRLRQSIIAVHESFLERGQHVSYLILDFRMVEEVDTTAVKKIKKLLRYTDEQGLLTIITNLTTRMRENFEEAGVCPEKTVHGHGHGHGHETTIGVRTLRLFDEADDAVEWASDQLLKRSSKMNFLHIDPVKGRHTLKTIARSILTNIKFGFGPMVKG